MKQPPRWIWDLAAGLIVGSINMFLVIRALFGFSALLLTPIVFLGISMGLERLWQYWHPIRLENECARCGYNLTGNVSGVCPECGTPVRP